MRTIIVEQVSKVSKKCAGCGEWIRKYERVLVVRDDRDRYCVHCLGLAQTNHPGASVQLKG